MLDKKTMSIALGAGFRPPLLRLYYIELLCYIIHITYICRYCILFLFTYYILCILCICTYRLIDMHTPIHIAPCVCVCVSLRERRSTILSHDQQRIAAELSACRAPCLTASSSRTLNVTMALLLWGRLAMANAGISHVFALFQLFNRAFWYLLAHFCVGRKVEDLPSSRTYQNKDTTFISTQRSQR